MMIRAAIFMLITICRLRHYYYYFDDIITIIFTPFADTRFRQRR